MQSFQNIHFQLCQIFIKCLQLDVLTTTGEWSRRCAHSALRQLTLFPHDPPTSLHLWVMNIISANRIRVQADQLPVFWPLCGTVDPSTKIIFCRFLNGTLHHASTNFLLNSFEVVQCKFSEDVLPVSALVLSCCRFSFTVQRCGTGCCMSTATRSNTPMCLWRWLSGVDYVWCKGVKWVLMVVCLSELVLWWTNNFPRACCPTLTLGKPW